VPVNDTLVPTEAAHIATNAYFTLKNWINEKPVAGVEARANVKNRVLGSGNVGSNQGTINPTLRDTQLKSGRLGTIHTAETGFDVTSGFGYTLTYKAPDKTHVIVAIRGTRPEMAGKPDLLTDAYGALTGFAGLGPVHAGFKRTYESILPSLEKDRRLIASADVVHFVGHSLGGAVATLLAAQYAGSAKAVKLYTFGSPRVGAFTTYQALEGRIGPLNIFRVAHDLDPISLIGPFPYIHVNPSPHSARFMTLLSPFGKILSVANHDMTQYLKTVGRKDWSALERESKMVDHDESILARVLLHEDNNPGWVQYASAKTLTILFKLFSHALKGISTSLILGLTAVDLLAELLQQGIQKLKILGKQIYQLMCYAAKWAGIKLTEGAQFTAAIIKLILDKMLATLGTMAMVALTRPPLGLSPMDIGLPVAWTLMAYGAL
jgi:pimeloyl-ACP methyl ester carboxylesterase